jgi:Xaa-Pro aminopeptidase
VPDDRNIGHLPFSFSLAERDRRYARVRAMMAGRGFEALLVPCNTGHNEAFQADVRYLSQIGGFANEAIVFFPAEGAPTCWVRADSQPPSWWQDMQDWVRDVRGSSCDWSANFATSIREHGLEAGRLGVVGMGGTPRSPDGLILHGTVTRLQDWFPRLRLESATEAMAQVRLLKSAEELAALERATEIAEQSVLAAAAAARPGLSEHEVYAEIVACMLRQGAELPTLVLWGAGASPNRMSRLPPVRPIEAGDVIISEVEARYAGYIAQVRRPIFIGPPTPEYARLHDQAVQAFDRMYACLRPGATYEQVVQAYIGPAREQGLEPLAVPLHGRGLGEDLPVLNVGHLDSPVMRTTIQAGQAFIMGPRLGTPDGSKVLAWGDMVAVTEDGARRLGKRPNQPIVVAL